MTITSLARKAAHGAMAALFCFGAISANARDHVLIMTIGDYRHVKQLPGVRHDQANALELARALGYDVSRPRLLKEEQLEGDGIQRAVASLAAEVVSGDRLFLYYSGHGVSYPVSGGCAEGLVPFDASPENMNFVRTNDLIRTLDGVRDKLSDAFVFFDACHSGGHREVVLGSGKGVRGPNEAAGTGGLTGKSVAVRGGDQCIKVANKSAFGQFDTSKSAPVRGMSLSLKRNFTLIAAARENEEALDQNSKGGLATTAMLQCARSGVVNTSGTGLVNVDELRACAQEIIETTVPLISSTHQPHHVEVYSNASRTLPTVAALPAKPGSGPDEATRMLNVFDQVASNSQPNLEFSAWFSKDRVPLGSEVILSYSNRVRGFMTVLYVGSDRGKLEPLLINYPVDPSANKELGPTTISKPVGENTFLVMLTQDPIDEKAVLSGFKSGGKFVLTQSLSMNLVCVIEGTRNATAFNPGVLNTCQKRNATAFNPKGKVGNSQATNGGFQNDYGAIVLRVTGQ